jgi:hypothetical protein
LKPPMVCAAFPKKKKEANDTIKEKKGPLNKLAWGSLFAKGLKNDGKGMMPIVFSVIISY